MDAETEGCVRCGVMTRSRCQACVNPLCGPCTGYPHETLYFLSTTPAQNHSLGMGAPCRCETSTRTARSAQAAAFLLRKYLTSQVPGWTSAWAKNSLLASVLYLLVVTHLANLPGPEIIIRAQGRGGRGVCARSCV